jgi:hypothetical protein
VDQVIVGDERRQVGTRHLAKRLLQRILGDVGIQTLEPLPQAAFQDHLAVIASLGGCFARRDFWPRQDRVAEAFQPGQRRLFDDRFGKSLLYRHLETPMSNWTRIEPRIGVNWSELE